MTVLLQSTLTCPSCGVAKVETMPTNACQYFYECTACNTLLKPKQGDAACSVPMGRCLARQFKRAKVTTAAPASAGDIEYESQSTCTFNMIRSINLRAQRS